MVKLLPHLLFGAMQEARRREELIREGLRKGIVVLPFCSKYISVGCAGLSDEIVAVGSKIER